MTMSGSESPLWTKMSASSGSEWEIDEDSKEPTTINYSMVFHTENGPPSDVVKLMKRSGDSEDDLNENNSKKSKASGKNIENLYPYAHPKRGPIAFEEIVTTFNALYYQFCALKSGTNPKYADDIRFTGKIYFDGLSETFSNQHRDDGFLSVDSPGNDTDWKLLIFIDAIISFLLHRDSATNKKYQQKQNLICAVRYVLHEIHGVNVNDISATDNLVSFNSNEDKHFADAASLREHIKEKFLIRNGKSKGKYIAIAEDFLETLEKREKLGPMLHAIINKLVFQICDTHRDMALPCASGRIVSPFAFNTTTQRTVSKQIESVSDQMKYPIQVAPVNKFHELLACINLRFELINSRLDKIAAPRSAASVKTSQISKVKPQKATKHIRKHLRSGDWCSPGSVVGIYADGIGLPSIDAESFGVVEIVKSPDTIVREWSPVTSVPSISVPAELENVVVQSKSVSVVFNGSTHVKLVDKGLIKLLLSSNSIEVLCVNDEGAIFIWDKFQSSVRFIGLIWINAPLAACPSELVANLTLISNCSDESAIVKDVMNKIKTAEEIVQRIEKVGSSLPAK